MSKHIADQREPSTGGRAKAFLRIARAGRDTFHKPRETNDSARSHRLQQFLRIARGRLS